ncbi:MAG: ribosome recycling factor, partial [Spirochaetales bacterium]|nr:ribosome recycling factor [Spirochaetales bacterium]
MQQVLDTCESKMQKSLESLSKDFASLRTGRASASLL